MSKFNINVPEGIPIKSLNELDAALEKMKDEKNEVIQKHSTTTIK